MTNRTLVARVKRAIGEMADAYGIEFRPNLRCCSTDALAAMKSRRGVYWHKQDQEDLSRSGVLHVRYFDDTGNAGLLGRMIFGVLHFAGLDPKWDGIPAHTITVGAEIVARSARQKRGPA